MNLRTISGHNSDIAVIYTAVMYSVILIASTEPILINRGNNALYNSIPVERQDRVA